MTYTEQDEPGMIYIDYMQDFELCFIIGALFFKKYALKVIINRLTT